MAEATKTITVGELLQDIDAAVARMGTSNPHRTLLQRCGLGLIELARRARQVEEPVETIGYVEADNQPVMVNDD